MDAILKYTNKYLDDEFNLESEYSFYIEGVIDDIKVWYKKRLTSEELDEAKKELKKILSTIKIPEYKLTLDLFWTKLDQKHAAMDVSPNFVHIIDRNGIADINLLDSYAFNDKGKHTWSAVKLAHKLIDDLNKKSKKYRYYITRHLTSTNGSGFNGTIYAYRKKDKVPEDSFEGKRIEDLSSQTIVVY